MANFLTQLVPRFDDLIQKLAWKIAAVLCTGMGLGGNDIITGPASFSGDFWCIHAFTDVVFNSVTFKPGTSTGSLAGRTLLAGDREYGNFLNVNIASGVLVCYRASAGSPHTP